MGKRIDNTVCHCLEMRRSAENVISFYDRILAPSGVTVRQYSLLGAVGQLDGCSVRELSDATMLDRSTLARSLKPLLGAGMIINTKEQGTRNSVLKLTEKGRSICAEAKELWTKAQSAFEEKIGTEQVQELEKILCTIQKL